MQVRSVRVKHLCCCCQLQTATVQAACSPSLQQVQQTVQNSRSCLALLQVSSRLQCARVASMQHSPPPQQVNLLHAAICALPTYYRAMAHPHLCHASGGTAKDTPHWRAQRPGPGAFSQAWGRGEGATERASASAAAPANLPAAVYEPTLGAIPFAPTNFVQLVANQITANLLQHQHWQAQPQPQMPLPQQQQQQQQQQPLQARQQQQQQQQVQLQQQPLPQQVQHRLLPLADGTLPSQAALPAALPPCLQGESPPKPRPAPAFPMWSQVATISDALCRWYEGIAGAPLKSLSMQVGLQLSSSQTSCSSVLLKMLQM